MKVRPIKVLSQSLFSSILLLSLADISIAQSFSRGENTSEQLKLASETLNAEATSIVSQKNIASSTSFGISQTNESASDYPSALTIETQTPVRSLTETEATDFQNQNLEPHNTLTILEIDL